jgi:hypothetical protein
VFPSTTVYFPPSLRALLAWTVLFRSASTLRNYLGFVKSGCMIAGVSTEVRNLACCRAALVAVQLQVFDNPALRKAKQSVVKAKNFTKREPLWLQRRAVWLGVGLSIAHRACGAGMWCKSCWRWGESGASFGTSPCCSCSLTLSFCDCLRKRCR